MKNHPLLFLIILSIAFVVLLTTLRPYYHPTPRVPVVPTASPTPTTTAPVIIHSPDINSPVSTPLHLSGSVSANWVWEGTFAVELYNSDDQLVSVNLAQVPHWTEGQTYSDFTVDIANSSQITSGYLVFRAENPSALPENNHSFNIPLQFSTSTTPTVKLYYFNSARDPDVVNCQANDFVDIPLTQTSTPLKFAINQLIYNYFLMDKGYEDRAVDFQLKSAVISNGIATLTFSDPKSYTSGGACRVGIIMDMIEKTARQFPSVNSVKLVGAPFQP